MTSLRAKKDPQENGINVSHYAEVGCLHPSQKHQLRPCALKLDGNAAIRLANEPSLARVTPVCESLPIHAR